MVRKSKSTPKPIPTFRSHPELVPGVRIQYCQLDSATRSGRIHDRKGNFVTVIDAVQHRRRIRLSEIQGYWKPKVRANPKNLILIKG